MIKINIDLPGQQYCEIKYDGYQTTIPDSIGQYVNELEACFEIIISHMKINNGTRLARIKIDE
jgi:hypothetical protein